MKLIIEIRLFPFAIANLTAALRRGVSGRSCTFYPQFTEWNCRQDLHCGCSWHPGAIAAVLDWLLSDCSVLGLSMQNWMWALPSVLLLYAAITVLIRSRRTDLQP